MRKLEDVITELQIELVESCHCQYDAENITKESFVCYPSSEEYVTFRAQLSSTADADSTTLLSLIEGWVSTGPTIRVSGVLRRVDKDCPVAISDFSEGECMMPDTTISASSQYSSTVAILGAFMAVAVVLVVILVVIILFMRKRHGYFCIKK